MLIVIASMLVDDLCVSELALSRVEARVGVSAVRFADCQQDSILE